MSSRSFSEADKIITVFSHDFGKLSLMAKGARRPKSRKRGSLEVFSRIKFIAHSGHGIPIMTEVEIIDTLSDIRKDLKKVSVAYFLAEAITRTTGEEKNEEIYVLLVNTLNTLKDEENLKKLRNNFTISLAKILGFIDKNQFVPNPDELLESIIERKLSTVRIGRKLQG